MLNPEKIWHKHLTHLSTSPVRFSHFSLGNPKKPFSTVLLASWSVHLFLDSSSCDQLIHTSDYLRYLRRKQTATHLPTRLKMSPLQYRQRTILAALQERKGSNKRQEKSAENGKIKVGEEVEKNRREVQEKWKNMANEGRANKGRKNKRTNKEGKVEG